MQMFDVHSEAIIESFDLAIRHDPRHFYYLSIHLQKPSGDRICHNNLDVSSTSFFDQKAFEIKIFIIVQRRGINWPLVKAH